MPRNYDSSLPGVPYHRVKDLSLSYDQQQHALIGFTDQRAVVTTTGAIEHLAGPGAERRGTLEITPQMWGQAIPRVINPTSGQTSGTITWGEIQLALTSGLRWKQLQDDAALDAPPPPPAPAE